MIRYASLALLLMLVSVAAMARADEGAAPSAKDGGAAQTPTVDPRFAELAAALRAEAEDLAKQAQGIVERLGSTNERHFAMERHLAWSRARIAELALQKGPASGAELDRANREALERHAMAAYLQARERLGPHLTDFTEEGDPAWLKAWIKQPDAHRLPSRMPTFFLSPGANAARIERLEQAIPTLHQAGLHDAATTAAVTLAQAKSALETTRPRMPTFNLHSKAAADRVLRLERAVAALDEAGLSEASQQAEVALERARADLDRTRAMRPPSDAGLLREVRALREELTELKTLVRRLLDAK